MTYTGICPGCNSRFHYPHAKPGYIEIVRCVACAPDSYSNVSSARQDRAIRCSPNSGRRPPDEERAIIEQLAAEITLKHFAALVHFARHAEFPRDVQVGAKTWLREKGLIRYKNGTGVTPRGLSVLALRSRS